MKNKLYKYFLVLIAVLSMMLSSCSDLFGGDNSNENTSTSTVRISLGENARTALPCVENPAEYKKIKFTYQKNVNDAELKSLPWTTDDTQTAYQKMQGASTPVDTGEYKFQLFAYFSDSDDESYYESDVVTQKMQPGENTISFTLTLKALNQAPSDGKGNLSLTVKDSGNSLSKIEAVVFKKGESDFEEKETLSKTGLGEGGAAGTKIEWADLDVGYYKILLKFYDANGVQSGYNVQYATIVKDATSRNIEEINANAGKNDVYTISYNLADGESFAGGATQAEKYSRFTDVTFPLVTAEGKLFLGWYETSDTSFANRITKIENGTRTGDVSLTARFIDAKEEPLLDSVTISDSTGESAQVGDTLSAVLKAGSEDFEGTVLSYQWYRGETEITGATSSTYKLTPADLGESISVKVKQKYKVTADASISGLYSVTEGGGEEVASSAVTVNAGTLRDSVPSTLKYNGENSVLIGTDLDVSKLSSQTTTLKDQAKNDVTVSIVFDTVTTAPESSGYVPLKATATGYTDVVVTGSDAVFIKVKANNPDVTGLLSTNVSSIAKGNIAFASPSTTLEYSTDATSWNAITTTEFVEPSSLKVRVKEVAGTEADTKENKVGYVEASDAVDITIENENKGTFCISSVVLGNEALKFGNTIMSSYTFPSARTYNADVDGSLSYQWYNGSGDSWSAITGATSASYKIASTDLIGKQLKLVVTQTHKKAGTSTVVEAVSSGNVANGTLSPSGSLSYSETAILGGTLNATKLSGLTFTDQAGTSVSPTLSFESTTVPNGGKSVDVKASLDGYDDLPLSVPITVKSPAPSGIGAYLSNEVSNIPYGRIRFTEAASTANVQYSTDGNSWTSVTGNLEISKPTQLFLRIGQYPGTDGTILASDSSADLAGSLDSYKGNLSLVIKSAESAPDSPAISFNNSDVTLTFAERTLTANNLPSGATATWEISGETLDDIIATSSDNSLTFRNDVEAGSYTVILFVERGTNLLSATYIVKIGSN